MGIKIALVEDNPSLQRRFLLNFSFFEEIHVLFSASSGEEFLEEMTRRKNSDEVMPSVILMDIELPGITGIETTLALKENFPSIEVMMITVFEDEERIMDSLRSGASGYLLKDEPPEMVVESIKGLLDGGAPMTPKIARKIIGSIQSPAEKSKEDRAGPGFDLSERELEIIKLLVEGKSYTQIAEELVISPHTVKTHIKNVYKKMHVHSKASLVKMAIKKGII